MTSSRLCEDYQIGFELAQRAVPGVVDVAVEEFGEPRVADARSVGDGLPVTLALLQQSPDFVVERNFHSSRIATFCYFHKQPIANEPPQSAVMTEKIITRTIADNLAYFMKAKNITQKELARKSGVGQTTISLYMRPEERKAPDASKLPSPSIAKVHALADALGIELWELVRPLKPAQRDLIRSVDALIAQHTKSEAETPAPAAPKKVIRSRRPREPLTGKLRRRGA